MGTEIPGDQHGSGDAPLQHIPAAMLPFSPAFFPALTKRKKGKEKKKKISAGGFHDNPIPGPRARWVPSRRAGAERWGNLKQGLQRTRVSWKRVGEAGDESCLGAPAPPGTSPPPPCPHFGFLSPPQLCFWRGRAAICSFGARGGHQTHGVSLGTAGVSVRGEDLGAGTQ